MTSSTASGSRRVVLDRKRYAGEWDFLEAIYPEVMGSRRPDMVSRSAVSRSHEYQLSRCRRDYENLLAEGIRRGSERGSAPAPQAGPPSHE